MNWLLITLFAYFLNAVAMVIDKTLLKKAIKNPFVYSFYIGVLGMVVALLIIPLGVYFPGWHNFIVAMGAGVTFALGLFLMFFGLKKEDASRLTPMIGGLVPVFVLGLAYYFLQEKLNINEIGAFLLILAGTFLISLNFGKGNKIRRALWWAIPAAFFYAVSAVLTKDVYNNQSFWSGLFWISFGTFVTVILPMLLPKNMYDLKHQEKDPNSKNTKARFLLGQACGGASNLLVKYAIAIASVTLVQALQGVQYVFIFMIVLLLAKYYPKILKEEMTGMVLKQKIISIIFIIVGIYLLAF